MKDEDDITAHRLLQSIYRDEEVALPVRMRAAIESLPYETPKLSASAISVMDGQTFAEALDRCIQRSQSPPQLNSPVVDAQVIEQPTRPYRRINGRSSPHRRW